VAIVGRGSEENTACKEIASFTPPQRQVSARQL